MYTRRPPKQPSSRVTSLNMLFLGSVQITGSLASTVNRIRCIRMIGMWCFKRCGYALTCFSCKALLGCYPLRNSNSASCLNLFKAKTSWQNETNFPEIQVSNCQESRKCTPPGQEKGLNRQEPHETLRFGKGKGRSFGDV